MKILHLIYTTGISGAEKYLLELLPGLKQHGIDCEFMCIGPAKSKPVLDDYCDQMSAGGIKTTLVLKKKWGYLDIPSKINKYLIQNNIKIIHSHLIIGDTLAVMVKLFYNRSIRIFSTKHGYQESYLIKYGKGEKKIPYDAYYFFSKIIATKIDEHITISRAVSEMYNILKIGGQQMKYVHHGVNIGQACLRETSAEHFPQIIIVGRLAEMKGHRFLIEALPLITAKFPKLKLLILGEGDLKNELIALAQKLKVSANVEFLGFQKPGKYIRDSQLMIVPSIFEPFGLVFIEAFAQKIPVIAFDVGAGNEIIENNVTGILVDPFNVNLLAEKIIYLLEDPEERKRIAENAYQKYLGSFTTDKMISETVAWYRSLY